MKRDINLAKKVAIYNSIAHTLGKKEEIYTYGIEEGYENEFILTINFIENIQSIPVKFSDDTLKALEGKTILKGIKKNDNEIVFMGKIALDLKFKINISDDDKDTNKIRITDFTYLSCNKFDFEVLNALVDSKSTTEVINSNVMKFLDKEVQSNARRYIIDLLSKLKFKRHLKLSQSDFIYEEITNEDIQLVRITKRKINEYAEFLKDYAESLNKILKLELSVSATPKNSRDTEENAEEKDRALRVYNYLVREAEDNDKFIKELAKCFSLLKDISFLKSDLSFIQKSLAQISYASDGISSKPASLISQLKFGKKTDFEGGENEFNDRKNELIISLLKNIKRILLPLESLNTVLRNFLEKAKEKDL